VRFDNRLGNGQTNTAAAERARAGLVDAVETLKQVRQMLRRDADTGVGDVEYDRVPLAFGAHLHAATCQRVAQRVAQEVDQHLCAFNRIQPRGQCVRLLL
jgi:hypothetical protein